MYTRVEKQFRLHGHFVSAVRRDTASAFVSVPLTPHTSSMR